MTDSEPRSAYEVLQVREDAEQIVIQAAYRALAALYHPDGNSAPNAERRMAELNGAYASVRSPDLRAVYDRSRKGKDAPPGRHPAATVVPPPPRQRPLNVDANGVLDFGRYIGWSLTDLARHDPDYLRWLSRHSSGIRYRQRIQALLPDPVKPRPPERRRGR